jgi:uncharacterized protein YndB with AHSA1/START domain
VLTRTLRVTRRFRASSARVFAAWLEPSIARRWLFATATRPLEYADLDARPGGTFRFVDRRRDAPIEYSGEYLLVDRPRRLGFTLARNELSPATTHVIVAIEGTSSGCRLSLVHELVPKDCARDVEGRWCGMLYGLAELLESIRVARDHRVGRPLNFSPTPAYRSMP